MKKAGNCRPSDCPPVRLEQAPDGLAAGARVVVALEHLEFVALDEVFTGEEGGRDLLLLNEAPQALGVDCEFPGCFNKVEVVVEGGDGGHGAGTSVSGVGAE